MCIWNSTTSYFAFILYKLLVSLKYHDIKKKKKVLNVILNVSALFFKTLYVTG